MSEPRFPECHDCAFEGVEPVICEECEDADQFKDIDDDSAIREFPVYFRDWREAA